MKILFESAVREIRPRRRIPLDISRMITMADLSIYLSIYLCAHTRCEQQLIIVVVNTVARSTCLVYLSMCTSQMRTTATAASDCSRLTWVAVSCLGISITGIVIGIIIIIVIIIIALDCCGLPWIDLYCESEIFHEHTDGKIYRLDGQRERHG